MNATYAYTPSIWPMLAVAVIAAGVSFYALHWRSKPGAIPLAMTCMFAGVWAMGCVLEIAAVDVSTRIFWSAFQAPWKVATATAEFCFVLEYADPGRWLNRRTLALLSFPVLLVFLLTVTNSAHHLMFLGFTNDEYPRPVPGIVNILLAVYALGVLNVLQLVILIWLAVRSPQHRVPVALMVIGQVSVRAATVVDWIGASPLAPTDVGLLFAAVLYLLYAFVIARFHLFDLVPVARATGIEQMEAGLVVLDTNRHIVDINPAAERILGVGLRQLHGRSIQTLPLYADLQARLDHAQMSPSDLVIGTGSDARYYALALTPLMGRNGMLLGHNVLFYDVTEQKRAQAQIVEQQRALAMLVEREKLARELHDDIGQVLGYVKLQAQAARDRLTEDKKAAADTELAKLIAVAQDAHANVREYILAARSATATGFHLIPALHQYLRQFQEHYGVCVDLIASSEWADDALDPTVEVQLLRIIQEALNNVRKHAQARSVQVCLQIQDDHAQIVVQDDGTGFDPASQTNMPGQKYGLSFMRERAEEVGSSIVIHSTPGAGTQVVICAPQRKARGETGRQP